MQDEKRLRFAVLSPASMPGQPAALSWLEPQDLRHALPELPDFHYVTVSGRLSAVQNVVESNYRAWKRLAGFFTWSQTDIDPLAVCETLGEDSHEFIIPYVQARIGKHPQYVFARGGKHVLDQSHEISKVKFNCGPCLFSNRHLKVTATDGSSVSLLEPRIKITKHISKISVDRTLSLYEMEASTRQARLITDLIRCLPKNMPVTINMDIPLGQYYCYLLDAYQRDLLDRDTMLYWIELVLQRHNQVSEYMQVQLRRWSDSTGLAAPIIRRSSGLSMETYLSGFITRGKAIRPEDIVDELSSHDDAWRALRLIQPPQTFLDIIYASYVLELMRENLQDNGDGGGKTLTIDVDNREDERIYENAVRLYKKMRAVHTERRHPIAGFYPLEQLFVSGKNRWGLYTHDPGSTFADTEGNRYSIETLLNEVYKVPADTT